MDRDDDCYELIQKQNGNPLPAVGRVVAKDCERFTVTRRPEGDGPYQPRLAGPSDSWRHHHSLRQGEHSQPVSVISPKLRR